MLTASVFMGMVNAMMTSGLIGQWVDVFKTTTPEQKAAILKRSGVHMTSAHSSSPRLIRHFSDTLEVRDREV